MHHTTWTMHEYLFFIIGTAFIVTHELDAMRCHEWRIFPGLSRLSDRAGRDTFIVVHVPLFGALMWWVSTALENAVFVLSIFYLVHVGLHLIALRHQKNEFRDVLSWTIIVGAGSAGLLQLVL